MNTKELKKLAAVCRKAGIKRFKTTEFEFELADELPQAPTRRRKDAPTATSDTQRDIPVEDEMPSPEALLFWSSENPVNKIIEDQTEPTKKGQ